MNQGNIVAGRMLYIAAMLNDKRYQEALEAVAGVEEEISLLAKDHKERHTRKTKKAEATSSAT